MVGILKEYRFYLLCSWNHILAFNVELYSLFKLQILETVVILQGLFFLGGGFLFWPRHAACGIFVPRPGIKPVPPALEVRSLNHWTSREVPRTLFSN